jgi:hypothetical protein
VQVHASAFLSHEILPAAWSWGLTKWQASSLSTSSLMHHDASLLVR